MTKVAIVYHSGYGHTKLIAEDIRDGAESQSGVVVDLVTVEEAMNSMDRFDEADAIVFGSPTYMGSVSGPMAAFMDASSKPWFEGKWMDKIAGSFTNSGSMAGDKMNTLQQFSILAAQHGMIWVPLGIRNETSGPDMPSGAPEGLNRTGHYLGVGAQSENAAPGPDNPSAGDHRTARAYGERIAKAAKRWGRGTL